MAPKMKILEKISLDTLQNNLTDMNQPFKIIYEYNKAKISMSQIVSFAYTSRNHLLFSFEDH